jgi:hypothetical protein
MTERNRGNWLIGHAGRLALVLIVLAAMGWPGAGAMADAGSNGASSVLASTSSPEAVGPVATNADAETTTEAATPTEIATETPSPSAAAGTVESGSESPSIQTPEDAATPVEATETPDPTPTQPLAPVLLVKPRSAPDCAPLAGGPTAVEAGGAIDYDCVYKVKLIGERIAPTWIAIDWSIVAKATDGWNAQLSLAPNDPTAWTPLEAGKATVGVQTSWRPDASDAVVDAFNNSAEITFRLRLTRPACNTAAPTIDLTLAANVTMPGHDDAVITQPVDQPQPFSLTPELEPLVVAEPTVSITGFAIAPVAFSLTDQVTTGTVTIAIDNPVPQCRDWNVLVDVQSFVGDAVNGAVRLSAIGPVDGAGVEAAAPPLSDQDGPSVVAVIHAGAQPGQWTQTLGFDLTIPGQTGSGGYQSRATAGVVPRP